MNYIIKKRASNKIRTFYNNVAKKYAHTYSLTLMVKNMQDAVDAMGQIENGLIRRKPTLSRWSKYHMAMSKDKKWYFAYTVSGDDITIVDACHAQNMHESKDDEFNQFLIECINQYYKNWYEMLYHL